MSEKNWFYAEDEEPIGPYSSDEMKALYEKGTIALDSYVFKDGNEEWTTYEDSELVNSQESLPPTPDQVLQEQEEPKQEKKAIPPQQPNPENWYYAKNDQHVGPFSKEEMEKFLRIGQIQNNTLVYQEGMKDWIPLSQSELYSGFNYVQNNTASPVNQSAQKQKNGIKNLLIALIVLVVVLGGCGVGYVVYSNNKKNQEALAQAQLEKEAAEKAQEEAEEAQEEAEQAQEEAEQQAQQAQKEAQQAQQKAASAQQKSNSNRSSSNSSSEKSNNSSTTNKESTATGGTMTTNFDVNVRQSASKDATQVDYLYQGTQVNIEKTVNVGNEVWGQIGTDRWVCIYDGSQYLLS